MTTLVVHSLFSRFVLILIIELLSQLTVSEIVEQRVESSFDHLGRNCMIAVLFDETCAETASGLRPEDLTTHDQRREFCDMRSQLDLCVRSFPECKDRNVTAFLDKLCDFQARLELTRRSARLSGRCRAGFTACLDRPVTKRRWEEEEYCQAFSEDGELEGCFIGVNGCHNQDYRMFSRLRRLACRHKQQSGEVVAGGRDTTAASRSTTTVSPSHSDSKHGVRQATVRPEVQTLEENRGNQLVNSASTVATDSNKRSSLDSREDTGDARGDGTKGQGQAGYSQGEKGGEFHETVEVVVPRSRSSQGSSQPTHDNDSLGNTAPRTKCSFMLCIMMCMTYIITSVVIS